MRARFLPAALGLFLTALAPLAAQSPEGDTIDLEKANVPGQIRVLFLGNSYTFMWNMPGILRDMAAKANPPVKIFTHQLTWGGQTLSYYLKRTLAGEAKGNAGNLINAVKWDYVVLQRWDKDVVPEIVPKWAEIIKKNHPKTKILIYAWLSDGKDNPGSDPAWVQQQAQLAADKTGATIVPVAWAWAQFRKDHPGVKDVADDGWHPGAVRAYMTACAFYATILHQSPVGNPVREWYTWAPPESKGRGKLTPEMAADLQKIAWDAVRQHSNDPKFKFMR